MVIMSLSTLIKNQYIRERATYLRHALQDLDTNKYFKDKSHTYRPSIATDEYIPFKDISVKAYTQEVLKENKSVLINNYYNKDIEILGWINPETDKLVLFKSSYTLKKYATDRTIPSNSVLDVNNDVKILIYRVVGFDKDFKIKISKKPYPKSWDE